MSAVGASAGSHLLAVRNLTKLFGSFAACNGIDLEIRPGEIHALLLHFVTPFWVVVGVVATGLYLYCIGAVLQVFPKLGHADA